MKRAESGQGGMKGAKTVQCHAPQRDVRRALTYRKVHHERVHAHAESLGPCIRRQLPFVWMLAYGRYSEAQIHVIFLSSWAGTGLLFYFTQGDR